MTFAFAHNVDAFIGAQYAVDSTALTAGGAGDAVAVVGSSIDRVATDYPLSASFLVKYKATLAANATLSLSALVETAADSAFTVPTALATFPAAVFSTGAAGGSTNRGVARFPVDFAGAQQFVRITLTPDLSAANTDVATVSAVAVLGGQDHLPA